VFYQSHQSGIETLLLTKTTSSREATNRTNLELKREFPEVVLPDLNATNRTNLELKHRRKSLDKKNILSTNRTNLELKQINILLINDT